MKSAMAAVKNTPSEIAANCLLWHGQTLGSYSNMVRKMRLKVQQNVRESVHVIILIVSSCLMTAADTSMSGGHIWWWAINDDRVIACSVEIGEETSTALYISSAETDDFKPYHKGMWICCYTLTTKRSGLLVRSLALCLCVGFLQMLRFFPQFKNMPANCLVCTYPLFNYSFDLLQLTPWPYSVGWLVDCKKCIGINCQINHISHYPLVVVDITQSIDRRLKTSALHQHWSHWKCLINCKKAISCT